MFGLPVTLLQKFGRLMAKSGIAVFSGGTLGYFGYKDRTRYSNMLERYRRGYIFEFLCHDNADYVSRRELEGELGHMIRQEYTNNYNVICGEIGTGKTWSLVEAVQKEIQSKGAKGQGAPIYVTVSQGTSLASSLAQAINFSFDEHMNLPYLVSCLLQIQSLPSKDSDDKLARVLAAIERSCYEYKQKYQRSAVIVVDSLDMLYQEDPKSVSLLQRKARLWADTNVCKMVFVCNDRRTMEALQENKSYWGRAGHTLYVRDLDKEDAMNYLLQKHPVDPQSGDIPPITESLASAIYTTLGGRMQHLKIFKDHYYRGYSAEKAIGMLSDREREKFSRESDIPGMWTAVSMTMQSSSGGLPLCEMLRFVSKDTVNSLVDCDILMFERSHIGMIVKFQSPLTRYVVAEMDNEYMVVMDQLKSEQSWWGRLLSYVG